MSTGRCLHEGRAAQAWTHRHSPEPPLELTQNILPLSPGSHPCISQSSSCSAQCLPGGLLVVLSMNSGHSPVSLDGDELNASLQLYVPNCSSVEEKHCQTPACHGGPSSWMFGNERCRKIRRCFRSLVGLGLISVLGWVRAVEAMTILSRPSRAPSQSAAFLLYDLLPWLRFGLVLAQGER